MDVSKVAVYGTVAVIVATTLVSGPLVDAVDFTQERDETFDPNTGGATVTVLSTPDRARLDRGSFGAGAYYLQVPDATVRIADVSGQPILAYKIRIPELGYTRSTAHFIDEDNEGRMAVSIESDALPPDEIDRESYSGELLVVLRAGGSDEVLSRGPIPVDVTG